MQRSQFTVKIILRIIFLLGNMVLITMAIKQPLEKQMLFTLGVLCILLILQVVLLFEFLNRTNRNLLRFFMIIFDSDYSTHFQEKIKSSPYIELNKAFHKVINKYKILSRDKELQYYYLDEVVKHIKVGIISVNKSGKIEIMNNPACELLQWESVRSIRERTEGLDHFLHEYRKLSQLPKLPEFFLNFRNWKKLKCPCYSKGSFALCRGNFKKVTFD